MSQLGNVPADVIAARGLCPRANEGGNGPRTCAIVVCRMHLRAPATRGPNASSRRVRLMVLTDDTCARDVETRMREDGVELTFAQLGELLGCSRQAAEAACRRALEKVRRKFREKR